MMKKGLRSPILGLKALFLPLERRLRRPPAGRRDLPSGQAYTEYVVILLFGVFLGLGVMVIDPEQIRIMDRLYGYMFDYYAGLANYLSLPIF